MAKAKAPYSISPAQADWLKEQFALSPDFVQRLKLSPETADYFKRLQPLVDAPAAKAPPHSLKRARTEKQDVSVSILLRLYANGVIPEGTRPATVKKQIQDGWKAECRARGIKAPAPPGWDFAKATIKRWRKRRFGKIR
jgi:hypothetical protein